MKRKKRSNKLSGSYPTTALPNIPRCTYEDLINGYKKKFTAAVDQSKVTVFGKAQSVLTEAEIQAALARHRVCDWGDCSEEDKKENLIRICPCAEEMVLSVYHSQSGVKFYIITWYDRVDTGVLLAEEYEEYSNEYSKTHPTILPWKTEAK